MAFNLIDLMIVAAFSLFAIAEVLVAYKKHQMKKQFVEELDKYEVEKNRSAADDAQSNN